MNPMMGTGILIGVQPGLLNGQAGGGEGATATAEGLRLGLDRVRSRETPGGLGVR